MCTITVKGVVCIECKTESFIPKQWGGCGASNCLQREFIARDKRDGIESALTMKIDLDESLGKLHFVRRLVPETALVFWNAGASSGLQPPVEGQIEHAWSENYAGQTYLFFGPSHVC